MTNREKFNSVYNDVLADMLCSASDGGIKCKFCCYTSGDCFGKNCFDGVKRWLRTNRNKFNAMDSAKLADILRRTHLGDKCQFCCYSSGNCFEKNKSCLDGIKKWLSAPCANEPENPPADKIDKPRKHLPRETLNSKTMINNVTADNVNHPAHYNREGAMECIREMVVVFGYEATINFCKLNAWKYRYRASEKNGAEDMAKSDWYVKMVEELTAEAAYF